MEITNKLNYDNKADINFKLNESWLLVCGMFWSIRKSWRSWRAKVSERKTYCKNDSLYKKYSKRLSVYSKEFIIVSEKKIGIENKESLIETLDNRINEIEIGLLGDKYSNVDFFESKIEDLQNKRDKYLKELNQLCIELGRNEYNCKVYKKKADVIKRKLPFV